MNVSYILTGANLGERQQALSAARTAIENSCGRILDASGIYETEAWGNIKQDAYLNQALKIETEMNPRELLHCLLNIEREMGRVRSVKYAPRTIDIDIIFFNYDIVNEEDLTIPHPQLHKRKFALQCLHDIAPDYMHRVFQKSVNQLLEECKDELQVKRWE